MPSQDEYLDDLLKDLTDNLDEGKDAPLTDIDMSDMDALLQSATAAHEEFGLSDADSIIEELEKVDDASESVGIEDMSNMTEEDIIKLLEGGQQDSEKKSTDEVDDLMSLLNETDDKDLQEIQNLLQKADNNELIEEGGVDSNVVPESTEMSERQKKQEEKKQQREAQKEAKKAAKEARKAEKEAKKAEKRAAKAAKSIKMENLEEDLGGFEPVTEEAISQEQKQLEEEIAAMDFLNDFVMEESITQSVDSASADALAEVMKDNKEEKKKGLFSRFIDFLNEETDENEEIQLSDENKAILKEIEKEKKKGKKKKAKQAKTIAVEGEEGENGESNTKKSKKPKKEKKQKVERVPNSENNEIPEKKLPKKKVLLIVLACLSIGIFIVICSNVFGDYTDKIVGKKAYYAGDYQTCFQNLNGKTLDESEQVMYNKSECILTIRLWLREYELLVEEGSEMEALDILIQAVDDYPTLYGYSVQWNAGSEVAEIYAQILQILIDKYHLTENQVLEIAAIPSDVEYTRAVLAVVQGNYVGPAESENTVQNGVMDTLPEEAELEDTEFIDNNSGQ